MGIASKRRDAAGIVLPKKKMQKTQEELEAEDLGELGDVWSGKGVIKSNHFEHWKNGFAKKDYVKVKNVINPASGLSYNPNFDAHQKILKEVVEKEEEIILKN